MKAVNKKKVIKMWILILFFIISATGIINIISNTVNHVKLSSAYEKHGWQMIVVNADNYVPDDYEIDFIELSNEEKVDSRIYEDLQAMFDDARKDGVYPFVREGYRTKEEQQNIMNEKIEKLKNGGYSKVQAESIAKESVAVPGTSEHELGIAVDINAETDKCNSDELYNWLAQNAHKYGFIQRYPLNKTDITGIIYEPWHYRYVGKEAAQIIFENNLCLEEYVIEYL